MTSILIGLAILVLILVTRSLLQMNEVKKQQQKHLNHYLKLFEDTSSKKLVEAIIKEDAGKIQALAEDGANLQSVGLHETTPLRIAIEAGKPKMLSLLLDLGADANFITPKGVTAAWYAVDNSNPEYLRILLDHGLNPDITFDGTHIIFQAVHYPQNYDMLVASGADLSVKENVSNSNLGIRLAQIADYSHLRQLIEKGIDVTEPNVNKDSVMTILADQQERFGADPDHPGFKARAEILELLKSKLSL